MSLQTSVPATRGSVFTHRAFDRAIEPLYAPLCRYAAARCGAQEAPDLVQSALLCAWSVIERFDASQSPGRLLLWLRRFVDYACDDALRARARHPKEPLTDSLRRELEERPDDDPADLTAAYRTELRALIAHAQLTDRQKVCLHCWLDGWTQQRIAAELGLHPGTVWEHLEEAKRRLQRGRISQEIVIREVFEEEGRRTRYRAPEPVGAALAREHLAHLAAQDARHAALCRNRATPPGRRRASTRSHCSGSPYRGATDSQNSSYPRQAGLRNGR